jgi:hypothetical protein
MFIIRSINKMWLSYTKQSVRYIKWAKHKEDFVKLHKYMRIYLWTILRIKFFRRRFLRQAHDEVTGFTLLSQPQKGTGKRTSGNQGIRKKDIRKAGY